MWHSVTYREAGSFQWSSHRESWTSSYMTRQDLSKGCKALWNIWTDLIRFKLSYSDDFWRPYYTVCMFLMWGFNEWRMVSHWAQVRTAGTVSTGRSVTSVTSIKLPGWPHGATVSWLDAFSAWFNSDVQSLERHWQDVAGCLFEALQHIAFCNMWGWVKTLAPSEPQNSW